MIRTVYDKFYTHTDEQTNLLFMKFFYTSIDFQTRRRTFKRNCVCVGAWYDKPRDLFLDYESLSDFIKLGRYI